MWIMVVNLRLWTCQGTKAAQGFDVGQSGGAEC